mmetsp:Transcript_92026/g.201680  ORF Transcript_92026/g.201680 Transcript_92026/m.201680 type:complete len:241 (-) Transcript_92026:563-1285(-)
MQMMGFFVCLIILMRAALPPRSPAPRPSTSSIMIKHRLVEGIVPSTGPPRPFGPKEMVRFPARQSDMVLMIFCPRASEALYSSTSVHPKALATNLAAVVLPMPGGPLTSAARALMLSGMPPPGLKRTAFLRPRSTTSSQSRSQVDSFFTPFALPSNSSRASGLCLSTQGRARSLADSKVLSTTTIGFAVAAATFASPLTAAKSSSSWSSRSTSGHRPFLDLSSKYFLYFDVSSTLRPSSR